MNKVRKSRMRAVAWTFTQVVFWAAIIVFMSPHEPDLGLGRPVTTMEDTAPLKVRACERKGAHCSHLLNTLGIAWEDAALCLAALREDFSRRSDASQG